MIQLAKDVTTQLKTVDAKALAVIEEARRAFYRNVQQVGVVFRPCLINSSRSSWSAKISSRKRIVRSTRLDCHWRERLQDLRFAPATTSAAGCSNAPARVNNFETPGMGV